MRMRQINPFYDFAYQEKYLASEAVLKILKSQVSGLL